MSTQVQLEKFDNLYDAVAFHVVSPQKLRTKFFNFLGFPTVSFQENHRSVAREYFESLDDAEADRILSALDARLENFLRYTNKVIMLVRSSDELMAKVLQELDDFFERDEKTSFKDEYPNFPEVPVDISSDYEAISKDVVGGVTTYSLGRSRRYQQSFSLDAEDIKDEVFRDEMMVTRVSASALVNECTVDHLAIRHSQNVIEIRVGGAERLPVHAKNECFTHIMNFLRAECDIAFGDSVVNYFYAIKPLYHENSHGCRVTRLDFLTNQGVGRDEKSARDIIDIRGEDYHFTGANSIGHDFQTYGIRKCWSLPDGRSVDNCKIDIRGKQSVLKKPYPRIDQVFLLDAYSASNYNFLVQKLLDSLPPQP
ncbi:hypothetical protein [Chromohalobacter canadensis]|uniref:hypothetical protein n=1 Tax=Chromohalobacter canadensis TaxID=141389 RepID=UPI00240F4BB8|nr:hypothetical protein [Chromohalobacter canadensis]